MASDAGVPEYADEATWKQLTPFRRAVLHLLYISVAKGQVTTYKSLADALNSSSRAVGQAMKNNPFAPTVPCHRVVRSDCTLGGFHGHDDPASPEVQRKIKLLQQERVKLSPDLNYVQKQSVVWDIPAGLAEDARVVAGRAGPAATASRAGKKRTRAASAYKRPSALRAAAASGRWTGPTCGQCPGYAQANMVIMPVKYAADFRAYCAANPQPCPLLEELPAGQFKTATFARGADVRTDLPAYRVYEYGKLTRTVHDISDLWKDSSAGPEALVTFLLGCSFSFEEALASAGLPLRHVDENANVPMYRTTRPTVAAGPFAGPLVVSMRPMTHSQAKQAAAITAKFPAVHGAPVGAGNTEELGIADIHKPDYGDAVTIHDGEVPVFWACGVTSQAALLEAKLPFVITHAPGHMLVGDVTNVNLAEKQ